jgi:GT2 family glycosyltransferase
MTGPDLSVIVLSYNTRDLTLACLRAVPAAAAGLETELIVVDNHSSDDTAACVAAQLPLARLIVNDRNLGFARGNNVGLAAARGRCLMLLNSDAIAAPGALRTLVEFMDAHPEAGACGPQLLNSDGSLQPSGRDLPTAWSVFSGMLRLYRLRRGSFYSQPGRDYSQTARVAELSGAALLVRREAYERTGGFDPHFFAYYEDVDWCKRLGEAGYALYYVPAAQVVHAWSATSRTMGQVPYRAAQDSLRYYFAKHHSWPARAAIGALLIAKELVLVLHALLRRDRSRLAFHRAMLARACRPLRLDPA